MASLDRHRGDPHQEISMSGRIIDALGPDVSVVLINGGSTILMEAFCQYLGSGYCRKVNDYPFFDLRLFNQCLQGTTSSVFGSLNGYATTDFIVCQLKSTEARDWMSSRPALMKAIFTNDLGMPHVVEVPANSIGVWPLMVSYFRETGRKDEGDSLWIRSCFFGCVSAISYPCILYS